MKEVDVDDIKVLWRELRNTKRLIESLKLRVEMLEERSLNAKYERRTIE